MGKLLEGVLDEMLEGMQVISPDWRYVYVNDTVAQQGKRRKDELLGRTMMECYPGIEKTAFFEQLRNCMERRVSVKMENQFDFPDGTTGWFDLYLHPVTEGVLILSLDITTRKVSEDLLRRKIEELDSMMDITVGRELRIVEMKRMVAKLKEMAPPFAPSPEPL